MKIFAAKKTHSAPTMHNVRSHVHHPMGPLQQAQRAEIYRILRSSGAQAKLTIGQLNDKYEQEADRVADQVMAMPDSRLQCQPENEEEQGTIQTKPLADIVTPLVQRRAEAAEEEELKAESKPGETRTITPSLKSRVNDLKSHGKPLDAETRSFFEPRFGYSFRQVRLHTDNKAAETAKSINARAFTLGNHIAMGSGEYQPRLRSGQRLLGHELAHVLQQRRGNERGNIQSLGPIKLDPSADISIMRKSRNAESRIVTPKIDYERAKKQNKYFAKKNVLGWAGKLFEVSEGAYKDWGVLWREKKYNEFADAVAEYQVKLKWTGKEIDGVLGLNSWAKISGIGEAIAGIQRVRWKDSESVCTKATAERIVRGHKLAIGKSLKLAEDKSMSEYSAILHSRTGRMLDVDVKYRGAGAAGALAYAGLGTLVSEADIWTGKLEPGATIQVWGNKKAYRLLRAGEIGKGQNKRRISNSDANFYGTSFVFVRYDSKTNERMLVRHYGSTEWKRKSSYAVWVAANLIST